MPKPRARAHVAQEFAVLPWQEAKARGADAAPEPGALFTIQSVQLVAPEDAQRRASATFAKAPALVPPPEPEPGATTGWLSRPAKRRESAPSADREAAATPTDRRAGGSPAAGGSPGGGSAPVESADTQPPTFSDASDADGAADADADPAATSPASAPAAAAAAGAAVLSGVCQLAIAPSGRGMGHIILPPARPRQATADSLPVFGSRAAAAAAGAPVCLGIATRPVARRVPPDTCLAGDDGLALLHVRLSSFARSSGGIPSGSSAAATGTPTADAAAATRRGGHAEGSGARGGGGAATGPAAAAATAVEVLLARTGGDMVRLAPPDAATRRAWLGDSGSDSDTDSPDRGNAAEEDEDDGGGRRGGEEAGRLGSAEGVGGERGGGDEAEDEWAGAVSRLGGHGAPADARFRRGRSERGRRRRRPDALELAFEAETLLSGGAAMPQLMAWARPLLGADGGEGGEVVVVTGPVTLRGVPGPLLAGP